MNAVLCACKFLDAPRCAEAYQIDECTCACHRIVKLEHGGIAYEVSLLLAAAIERAGRHPSRRLQLVRACERDRVLCVLDVITCRCCGLHGTKSPGGGSIYYPEDKLGHVVLMTIDAFSDWAFQEGAIA